MNLARGAGTNAEIVAVKLAHKYGDKILTKVCKLNFTNTKRVKGSIKEIKRRPIGLLLHLENHY